MNGKLLDRIESLFASHKALVLIIIGLFLIRIPSLLEPLWYGDEAIYVTIGQEINRGGLLYVDIFDHKTPGIYYWANSGVKSAMCFFRDLHGTDKYCFKKRVGNHSAVIPVDPGNNGIFFP